MKRNINKPQFAANASVFEQVCEGLVHLRRKEEFDQELMLKMHEGMAKVIAGQLRIARAFRSAAQAA